MWKVIVLTNLMSRCEYSLPDAPTLHGMYLGTNQLRLLVAEYSSDYIGIITSSSYCIMPMSHSSLEDFETSLRKGSISGWLVARHGYQLAKEGPVMVRVICSANFPPTSVCVTGLFTDHVGESVMDSTKRSRCSRESAEIARLMGNGWYHLPDVSQMSSMYSGVSAAPKLVGSPMRPKVRLARRKVELSSVSLADALFHMLSDELISLSRTGHYVLILNGTPLNPAPSGGSTCA